MIDVAFMRSAPGEFRELVHKKEPSFNVDRLIELDAGIRLLQTRIDQLRNQRHQKAEAARAGGLSEQDREEARTLNKELKLQEELLAAQTSEFRTLALSCPNPPLADVPLGGKEANVVVRTYGAPRKFEFKPKNHLELNERLGWFDFAAGARIASSQFVFYRSEAVQLMYTLAMLMVQHNQRKGYSLVLPPYVVNEACMEGSSQFPKFKDAVYAIPEDGLFLTPTSEVNLTGLYRDHIFSIEDLPVRMTAWTSCFRREAGSYGASERGLIRIHQFEKVELYTLCIPENGAAEHERMLACAEEILQLLGLHYRVSLLAAQDASFAAAKTYDLEVWMPGQGEYREVSSSSLCGDFQARRSGIKYYPYAGAKPHYVYTLNTSSLALPRIMVALMETYQQADGSIDLPPVLDQINWVRKTV